MCAFESTSNHVKAHKIHIKRAHFHKITYSLNIKTRYTAVDNAGKRRYSNILRLRHIFRMKCILNLLLHINHMLWMKTRNGKRSVRHRYRHLYKQLCVAYPFTKHEACKSNAEYTQMQGMLHLYQKKGTTIHRYCIQYGFFFSLVSGTYNQLRLYSVHTIWKLFLLSHLTQHHQK